MEKIPANKNRMISKKNISGIYAIGFEDIILYIGQSKSIGDRMLSHFEERAFEKTIDKIIKEDGQANRCKTLAMYYYIKENKKYIWFTILEECSLDKLNELEEKYINQYKPRYNYAGVDIPFKSFSR